MPSHSDRVRRNYDDGWWEPAPIRLRFRGSSVVADPTVPRNTVFLSTPYGRRTWLQERFLEPASTRPAKRTGARQWFRAMRGRDIELALRDGHHFAQAFLSAPATGWTVFHTQDVVDRTTAPHYAPAGGYCEPGSGVPPPATHHSPIRVKWRDEFDRISRMFDAIDAALDQERPR